MLVYEFCLLGGTWLGMRSVFLSKLQVEALNARPRWPPAVAYIERVGAVLPEPLGAGHPARAQNREVVAPVRLFSVWRTIFGIRPFGVVLACYR